MTEVQEGLFSHYISWLDVYNAIRKKGVHIYCREIKNKFSDTV